MKNPASNIKLMSVKAVTIKDLLMISGNFLMLE